MHSGPTEILDVTSPYRGCFVPPLLFWYEINRLLKIAHVKQQKIRSKLCCTSDVSTLFFGIQFLLQTLQITSRRTNIPASEKVVMVKLMVRIIQRLSIQETFIFRDERSVTFPKFLPKSRAPCHLGEDTIGKEYE
mmetsp:Transcript_11412/g.18528  ORF Transcript_11412/g.18528 Transcript_11412/m.18528 type:complete len:135 (+) Transcript_11412:1177-1581(+)